MAGAVSTSTATPSLSLIVATVEGGPGYQPVFTTQRAAIDAPGGEMIVAALRAVAEIAGYVAGAGPSSNRFP